MCFDSFFHNLVLPDVPLPLIDASLSFLPGSMFIRTLHIVVRMSVKYCGFDANITPPHVRFDLTYPPIYRSTWATMLLTSIRQNMDEYRRVGAESLITVQVEGITLAIHIGKTDK